VHIPRLEHSIDQHEAADDVANRGLLVGVDDASVAKSLGMKTQEICILGEDDPPLSGGL
jgi:hypothetical protein